MLELVLRANYASPAPSPGRAAEQALYSRFVERAFELALNNVERRSLKIRSHLIDDGGEVRRFHLIQRHNDLARFLLQVGMPRVSSPVGDLQQCVPHIRVVSGKIRRVHHSGQRLQIVENLKFDLGRTRRMSRVV